MSFCLGGSWRRLPDGPRLCFLSFLSYPRTITESPRIMVETTTDVPTVIYRCHVNSKLVTYLMRERVQCPNQWVRKNPWKIRSTGSQHLEREFTNQYYRPEKSAESHVLCLSQSMEKFGFLTLSKMIFWVQQNLESEYLGYFYYYFLRERDDSSTTIPWHYFGLHYRKMGYATTLLSNVLCGYFTLSNWREIWSKLIVAAAAVETINPRI